MEPVRSIYTSIVIAFQLELWSLDLPFSQKNWNDKKWNAINHIVICCNYLLPFELGSMKCRKNRRHTVKTIHCVGGKQSKINNERLKLNNTLKCFCLTISRRSLVEMDAHSYKLSNKKWWFASIIQLAYCTYEAKEAGLHLLLK